MRSAISSMRSTPSAKRHAPLAAELVDQNFVPGMSRDVLKQQRRPAGRVVLLIVAVEFGSLFPLPVPCSPIFDTRSVISVISSSGETSSRIRRSSPCFSSA